MGKTNQEILVGRYNPYVIKWNCVSMSLKL